MKSIILAGILASASLSAQAGNFYVLGEIGQSKIKESEIGSESDTMFGLGGGYSLNENFAFELAYRDLGGVKESDDNYEIDTSSLQLTALGKLPVGEGAYLFGRLGFARLDVEASYNDGEDSGFSDTATKAAYGFGMGYDFSDAFGLRAEYLQHAKWEDTTFSSISISATYSF